MIDKQYSEALFRAEARIGALARAIVILTGSLHQTGHIDGNAVAASMRLDSSSVEATDEYLDQIADLIRRTVARFEANGTRSLRPVEDGAVDRQGDGY